MLKQLLLILLLSTNCLASGNVIGWPAAGETNAVLAGNTTDYSGGGTATQASGSNAVYSIDNVFFNASATGTLRKGFLRVATATTASNLKMMVYRFSSGTTYNLVETSSAAAFSADSLMEFTFAGTNTITTGDDIILAVIADGYFSWRTGGNTWNQMDCSTGSYASPPTSVDTSADYNTAGATMEIYVRNY